MSPGRGYRAALRSIPPLALSMQAQGLLHVLRAGFPTGGGAGSRVFEAKKSRRGVQGPSARLGLLRRALDADPAPVTLPVRREGAHSIQAAAA